VALVTGSRVKIGYEASLMLLRAGASLIATTRFPCDSARRFAAEPDSADWRERLHIYGLDLRHTPSVEAFAAHVNEEFERLDFLIHNACQTVRRPPAYSAHLMESEIYEDLTPDPRPEGGPPGDGGGGSTPDRGGECGTDRRAPSGEHFNGTPGADPCGRHEPARPPR
jgi:hypothetical protein